MSSPSKLTTAPAKTVLRWRERELEGIDRWLADLEKLKGKAPERWRTGMIRHYRERRKLVLEQIRGLRRKVNKGRRKK